MINEEKKLVVEFMIAVVDLLKKIEENTRQESIEEKSSRIRGFANEKDNSPF